MNEPKKKHIVMLVGDKVNDEQTKCYCGHTTYCDCSPLEEPEQRLEKYSERFDNKENEVVEGIFNSENWGRRIVKMETLEEASKKNAIYELEKNYKQTKESFKLACKRSFLRGAKWQQINLTLDDAYSEGFENGYSDSDNTFELNKQYYNETFEKSVCPVCKCINGTTCSHSWHLYNK